MELNATSYEKTKKRAFVLPFLKQKIQFFKKQKETLRQLMRFC
jgi:hypothetical protein